MRFASCVLFAGCLLSYLGLSRAASADDAFVARSPEEVTPKKAPDLPVASDTPAMPEAPPPKWGLSNHLITVGLTMGPFVSQTTGAKTDVGGLAGLRVDAAGVDGSFAYRSNLEGRLGGSSDGFATRDRVVLGFGGAIPVNGFGAVTLRAGGDARYVRTGVVEYGRLFVPNMELGIYRTSGEGSVQIDLAAMGGLVPYASFHGGGGELDRSLAPGAGGTLGIGKKRVLGRISYVHVAGRGFVSDLDASLCFGEIFHVCAEADHTMADPDSGRLTSWRGLLTIGIGATDAR